MQQERNRQRIGQLGAGSGSDLFDDPDVGAGMATVTHGPFAEMLPVAQMTVSQVRSRFRDRLDIHPEAMAMLDGDPVDDTTTVQAGQTLMFIRPSGEKGSAVSVKLTGYGKKERARPPVPTVTIEGEEVRATLPEGAAAIMKLEDLLERIRPGVPDSRGTVLPDGVKCVLPTGDGCIVVHQTPPRVFNFPWISGDSKAEYGPETRYRQVRLALPYLIVLAVFERARGDLPRLGNRNECFFLNEPLDLKGLETELCYPALLNCSRFPDGPEYPLSWICTQHLPAREHGRAESLEQSLRGGLQALLRHLLESGFNRSSEHHELNSWFSESVAAGIDSRISSVESWERATTEDPLFVLDVPWLRTGISLGRAAERIVQAHGRARPRVTCADDVARVILNAKPKHGRTR